MAIGPAAIRNDDSGDCVARYIDKILDCYEELAGFKELKPCSKVDNTFERLVGLCSQCPGEETVSMVRDTHNNLLVDAKANEGLNRFCRTLESLL